MLNSLVNQHTYKQNHDSANYGKGFSAGSLLFFLLFWGLIFLCGQGIALFLPQAGAAFQPGEGTWKKAVAAVGTYGFSIIPGVSYEKEDLPPAYSWREGEAFLSWAAGYGVSMGSSDGDTNSLGAGKPQGDRETTLPVLPKADGGKENEILAARAEFRNMAPIGIYCTHTTESYIPDYGEAKAKGERGGIYDVAAALKDSLAKRGIPAVLSDAIHDYPDWEKSYSNSLSTMEEMKKKYPGMEIFIDVHRDALGSDDPLAAVIDGAEVSRLMLVVGSNKRANHPNWEQNLAFARQVGNALEHKAPGLLRSVRVQSGRYNQHLSSKAILVEVGCSNSGLTQAKKGVEYLAAALETVLLTGQAAGEQGKELPTKTSDGFLSGSEAVQMIKILP